MRLTDFLFLKKTGLVVFSLMERSLTICCQLGLYKFYSQIFDTYLSSWHFFYLDLNNYLSVFKLSETFCICLFSFLSYCFGWWNECLLWLIKRNIYLKIYPFLSFLLTEICMLRWLLPYNITGHYYKRIVLVNQII